MSDKQMMTFEDMSIKKDRTYMVEVIVDGEEGLVELRKITYAEFLRYERETPKVLPQGEMLPNGTVWRDYEDEEYKEQARARILLIGMKRMVASLCIDVPGETIDDKVHAIQSEWSSRLITQITQAISRLYARDGAALMPADTFQQNGNAGTGDDGDAADDA